MKKSTLAALVTAALCVLSSTGFAQEFDQETGAVELSPRRRHVKRRASARGPGPLRINAGLHFGGGGNLRVEEERFDNELDLDPIVGLQGGVDYVVMDYFAIGGELRLSFWKGDIDDGRSLFFDINVKPRGRYQFSNIPLELYGAMPLGLGVFKLNEGDGGAGFNFGFGPGVTYFFNERIGINSEMLAVWHWFNAEETLSSPLGSITVDADLRTAQFYFLVNAVIAL